MILVHSDLVIPEIVYVDGKKIKKLGDNDDIGYSLYQSYATVTELFSIEETTFFK